MKRRQTQRELIWLHQGINFGDHCNVFAGQTRPRHSTQDFMMSCECFNCIRLLFHLPGNLHTHCILCTIDSILVSP